MSSHWCYVGNGPGKIRCYCSRGVDHEEHEFDVPLEEEE